MSEMTRAWLLVALSALSAGLLGTRCTFSGTKDAQSSVSPSAEVTNPVQVEPVGALDPADVDLVDPDAEESPRGSEAGGENYQ